MRSGVTPQDESEPDRRLGEVFDGRYRIDALLGEGGLGTVYAAQHLSLGRQVALKVLLPEHEDAPLLRKRFEREARALSGLNHPHIVSITDVGVSGDTPYLVMELLEGTTLAEHARAHPVEPEEAFAIVRQILAAMAYAHRRGVVHRDLKPQNIFVVRIEDGSLHATVLDFGLARFLDEEARPGTQLTRRGALLGTPAYMAPEQAAGSRVDARADVYAAGLILFELLTGRRPFTAKDSSDLRRAHLLTPPPRLRDADPGLEADDRLEELIERALAKDAADRFRDAEAMLAELDALPEGAARRIGLQEKLPVDEAPTPDGLADTVDAMPIRELTSATMAPPTPPRPPGPPSHAERPASGRTVALVVGALGAGLVVLALAIAGLFILFGADAPSGPVASHDLEVEERSPPPDPAPSPSIPARASASDPLAGLPAELQPLHDAVASGRELSRTETGFLNRWSRAHPDDARSRLILARHFTSVRSLSWALPQYIEAYDIDPTVRRWPPMLTDLLEMVRSSTLTGPASELVVEAYGAEAITAVEAELAVRRPRDETERLERLAERLRSR